MSSGNNEIDSPSPTENEVAEACRKVFLAGCWLIRNGFGRMAVLPYATPSGCHWRCEYHPVGRPDRAFFRYSTGSGTRYLASHCGGSIRKDVSPRKLAESIMVSVPESLIEACSGEASAETLRWLDQAEAHVASGYIPEAFHEYTEDHSRWILFRTDGGNNSLMAPPPGYVVPGEELNVMSEEFWSAAEKRWNSISRSKQIGLGTGVLCDDDSCSDLAERVRHAFADVSGFEAIRVLRATVAAIHAQAQKTDGVRGGPLPVSTAPPDDPAVRRAGRLLSMVHELHKTGRQRLRVCAGHSHDGSEWRCAVTFSDNVLPDGWTPREFSLCADYAPEDGTGFFGWKDSAGKDARALAALFVERFPEIAAAAVGRDWAYAGWFAEMLGRAEHGRLPSFYEGVGMSFPDGVEPPPPPCGSEARLIESGTGFDLISNEDLTLADLPPRGAGYEALWPFCLTYNGHANGLRRIADCRAIADAAERKGLGRCSMDELRVTAFYRQRQAKQYDQEPPPASLVEAISNAVEEIRDRLSLTERKGL
ncbi:MAG: hypothetical protein L6Q69_14570 [Zoogloea sp.]|nr:hypothetical protein [Zoogloea sp.]